MNPLLLLLLSLGGFTLVATRRKGTPAAPEPESVSAPTDPPVRRQPALRMPPKRGVDPLKEVLRLTNGFRAKGGSCGGVGIGPAGALAWSAELAASALAHAKDMAERGYFDHVTPNGVRPEQRIAKAGWHAMPIGENIAAGQGLPAEVVQGWIDSPGHCKNLLNPNFKHLGVGYFYAPNTRYKHYWVQNFGG